jgi:hypothetical protein
MNSARLTQHYFSQQLAVKRAPSGGGGIWQERRNVAVFPTSERMIKLKHGTRIVVSLEPMLG